MSGEAIAILAGAAFALGCVLGAWLMSWILSAPRPAAGSAADPAVIDAVKNAGAPALERARDAAEEIKHAPDDDPVLAARIAALRERGRLGK